MIKCRFTANVDIVDHAQGQSMPEDTQMVSVNSDFVMLMLSEQDDLEGLIAFNPTQSVALFLLPRAVFKSVTHDHFIFWSDADVENDILIAVQCRRVDEINLAPDKRAMTH